MLSLLSTNPNPTRFIQIGAFPHAAYGGFERTHVGLLSGTMVGFSRECRLRVMSGLTACSRHVRFIPIPDIRRCRWDVRYVPLADIPLAKLSYSPGPFVGESVRITKSRLDAFKQGKLNGSLLRGRMRSGLTRIESALLRFLEGHAA